MWHKEGSEHGTGIFTWDSKTPRIFLMKGDLCVELGVVIVIPILICLEVSKHSSR